MLNLFLTLAALTGLSTLSQLMRVLVAILARVLATAFLMALAIIVLLALAAHGVLV